MRRKEIRGKFKNRPQAIAKIALLLVCVGATVLHPQANASETGVDDKTIKIGAVMDLAGDAKGLGQGMKIGIEAAIRGKKVQGRKIELLALNDYYNPQHTKEATEKLIKEGVFLTIGNVGTPTAKVSLPMLAKNKVPALGFFTGAGLLRPGVGDVVNFRASYVQEVATVIEAAIRAGVSPQGICAFVQNDAYGMAGVAGIKEALAKHSGTKGILQLLDQIMSMKGENPARNDIGPVGVYTRNTLKSREGYMSLKNWEQNTGNRCRLVVTVGAYAPIAGFVGYSRYKNEDWFISAVSFTGAENLKDALKQYRVKDRVIMTQVVPSLDSQLPIVKEAREAIGAGQFGYVSLEGYIVGKLFLKAMQDIETELTREAFLQAVRNSRFDLGGLKIDFTSDNQGSDLVMLMYLDGEEYRTIKSTDWKA